MAHPLRFITLGIALTLTLGSCGNNLISDSDSGDCTSYLSARNYDSARETMTGSIPAVMTVMCPVAVATRPLEKAHGMLGNGADPSSV